MELAYNELGYNEHSVITSKFSNFVWFVYKVNERRLGYNELGYNENSAIANIFMYKNCTFTIFITSNFASNLNFHYACGKHCFLQRLSVQKAIYFYL